MRHARSLTGLSAALLCLWSPDARAQGAAQGRLDVHGYLTQGFAVSDSAPFYGIRKDASTDFRYAALQLRYDRGSDVFLVQVNNRRLGRSQITDFESSVNLNWAFYERRFGDARSSLRLGRVPIPRGIYNEVRSVGTVLPFYRAPVIFYDEGAYFSETIDGVVLNHTVGRGSPWSVDAHLYAGGWSLLAYDQTGDVYAIGRVRAENAVGAQLWLNTPVTGLRLGAAAQRYDWEAVGSGEGALALRQKVWEVQGSVDGTFDRITVRGETMLQQYETDHYYANYAQLGVRVLPKLTVNGLAEYAYERAFQSDVWPLDFDWHKAVGVGLNYKVTPSFVLKAEHHWNRGVQVEEPVPDPTDAPRFRYLMLSVSASF